MSYPEEEIREKLPKHRLRIFDLFAFAVETGRQRFEFGERIERKTVKTLKKSPEVVDAKRVPRREKKLQEAGIDIIVKIEPVAVAEGGFDEVYVQVKSSSRGINGFYRHVAEQHQLIPEQVETWLTENRYIVLNGNKDEETVLSSFHTQLNAIISYLTLFPH